MDNLQDIEDAKTYMARKELFQLFESLITGLVHNRPDDPISFLQDCLQQVQQNKPVTWDAFLKLDDKQGKNTETQTDITNIEKIFETETETKEQ